LLRVAAVAAAQTIVVMTLALVVAVELWLQQVSL
jgi:hypothetical protein